MQQHFVTFLSPGTFVHETTTEPVESWDIEHATKRARDIVERYGARPFGFYFTTRERSDAELDSRESSRSCTYYLGGTVRTIADVEAANDPTEKILLSNMKCNGWNRIITNTNSFKITQPLNGTDVILEFTK